MKNIIPAALLAASTFLGGCNNHSAQGVMASKRSELGNVLNLPRSKEDSIKLGISDTMEASRQEGDTLTDAEADSIYRQEFIEPGPH